MTTQPTSSDDDSSNLEVDSSTATAELDATDSAEAIVSEWTGPTCEKCSAPLQSELVTICRKCGWYASFRQFMEIDQDWEIYEDEQQQSDQPKRVSHIEVWMNLLPWWAWVLIGTAVVVVAESVVARIVTPAGGVLRTVWSLTQLAVGSLVFAGCHIFNFLVAAADDAEVGAVDMVLKPVKLWIRAARNLPERLWVADMALGSLIAVVMSLVVIGGLPYHRLWDWGFAQPPKQNLTGAVVSRMQKNMGDDADSIEDAVVDFAGSQNLDNPNAPPPPPKPRQKVDCVILGYRLDAQGRLTSLILAASYRSELAYAGSVMPQLSEEELSELAARLAEAKTDTPFLRVRTSGTWVKPKLSCRVSYTKRSDTGRLRDIQWEEMLREIGLE